MSKLTIGTMPQSMWATLEDDLVDSCKPGDDVSIWYAHYEILYLNLIVLVITATFHIFESSNIMHFIHVILIFFVLLKQVYLRM